MKDSTQPKPLTPNIAGPEYYRPQKSNAILKYMPWAKGFETFHPPADHTIEIREESKQ